MASVSPRSRFLEVLGEGCLLAACAVFGLAALWVGTGTLLNYLLVRGWGLPVAASGAVLLLLIALRIVAWIGGGRETPAEVPEGGWGLWRCGLLLIPVVLLVLDKPSETYYSNRTAIVGTRGLERAVQDATTVLAFAPNPLAFNTLGNAYFHQRDYDRAIDAYTNALQPRPLDPVFLANRGHAYEARGDTKVGPKTINEAHQDYHRAVGDFGAIISVRPDSAAAHAARGNVYMKLSTFDQAARDFARAVQLDPGEPDYMRYQGDACYQMEKYGEAIEHYTKAIRLAKKATYFLRRGQAHRQLGHRRAAEQDDEIADAIDQGMTE